MVGSQVGLQLTRALAAIAIARLLTPEEYGLAALALVFASLVLVFSDLALGAALIQRKELSEVDRDTAFWVTLGSGFFFAILGFVLAGPLASLYGDADAKPLLQVLSLGFVVYALGAPQQSLMIRDMDFRRVEMLPMIGALAGAAAGVAVAANGAGAWAIIVQYAFGALVTTIAVWLRSEWRPRFAFSVDSLRDARQLQRLHARPPAPLLPADQRRPLPDRPLPRHGAAGRLRGRVQHDPPAGQQDRRPAPARDLTRLLPHPGRARADRGRLGARGPHPRGRLRAAARGPRRRGARTSSRSCSATSGTRRSRSSRSSRGSGIVQALQSLSVDVLMARDRARTIFRFSLLLVTCHLAAFAFGLNWGVVGVAGGVRDLHHARGAVADDPRGARARRLADGVRASDLRRLPGRRRDVPRHARRAPGARRRGSRPGPAAASSASVAGAWSTSRSAPGACRS